MKNIHVLPTDKPSRLIKNNLGLAINEYFTQSILDLIQAKFQNIYITSDEEFDKYNFVINSIGKIESVPNSKWGKKIILTTDQDLIKDGVQAIDNEFLEWFVKNTSCEFVEINKYAYTKPNFGNYKIIIPKEEPCDNCNNDVCCCIIRKQETFEEAAENYAKDIGNKNGTAQFDFKAGAKWQQEQDKKMYSEEELYKLTLESLDLGMKIRQDQLNGYSEKSGKELHKEWFEKFKKK